MRTLAFLSVLQNMTTGAYIAACVDTNAPVVEWAFAVCLVIMSGLFAVFVMTECSRR